MARILIVDDELVTLLYLREQLKKLGHEVVDSGKNGSEGISKTARHKPDLVFMDINMPGKYNGIEAARIIEERYNIPVIFITAYESEQYLREVKQLGPFGYITKPFNNSEVDASIHIAIFRSSIENRLKATIGKYRIQVEYDSIIQKVLNMINEQVDPWPALPGILCLVHKSLKLGRIAVYKWDKITKCMEFLAEHVSTTDARIKAPEKVDLSTLKKNELSLIRQPALYRDFSRFPRNETSYLKKLKVHSMMTCPIFLGHELYGLISFYRQKGPTLANRDIRRFLNIISFAVSLLIKRHLDYLRMQSDAREATIKEQMLIRSERLASLGQLSSAITHEIKQPLHTIQLLSDSAAWMRKNQKPMDQARLMETLSKISETTRKVSDIIANLRLVFQKPGKVKASYTEVSAPIIAMTDLYKARLKSLKISLELDLAPGKAKIMFPETQFQQILINLVDNAIKALTGSRKKNKEVKIKTALAKDSITITVSDNGGGIPDKIREKIFDPFFSMSDKKENIGMGLYIVHTILASFDGTIKAENGSKGGAVFTIKLPCKSVK